jgi:hypothetical protein
MRALDQNQISNKELITACQDSFLIPDIMWFENIKTDGWRDDVRRSFEIFHANPNRLHIAHPVGALLRREIQTRAPITDPVDWEGTRRLRELLSQTDYVTAIEANVEALRQGGLEPVIHLADNRQSLSDGMNALAKIVGPDKMRQLRSLMSTSKPQLIELAPCIAALTDRTLQDNLTELGVLGTDRAALSTRQSAFYRTQFCFWAQVFQFVMGSSTLDTGDRKLLNDLVDSDYVITASYCDALETKEDRLRQRYDALIVTIRQSA